MLVTCSVQSMGRYDQTDLNVYGAEDDDELDMILDALEKANAEDVPPAAR